MRLLTTEHLTEDIDRAMLELYMLGNGLKTGGIGRIAEFVNNSFNDFYDSGCHPL
ncbi:MAG: hypothetical protein GY820_10700 [Gammaproteobacteria bacterium]|nr:hypothetical protein [Gammaproteobacteria bacterium]